MENVYRIARHPMIDVSSSHIVIGSSTIDLYDSKICPNTAYFQKHKLFSYGTGEAGHKMGQSMIRIAYSESSISSLYSGGKMVIVNTYSGNDLEKDQMQICNIENVSKDASYIYIKTIEAIDVSIPGQSDSLLIYYGLILTDASPRILGKITTANGYCMNVHLDYSHDYAINPVSIIADYIGISSYSSEYAIRELFYPVSTPLGIQGRIHGNNIIQITWDGADRRCYAVSGKSEYKSEYRKNRISWFEVMKILSYQRLDISDIEGTSLSGKRDIHKVLTESLQIEIPIKFGYMYAYFAVRKVNAKHSSPWSKIVMIPLKGTIAGGIENMDDMMVDIISNNCRVSNYGPSSANDYKREIVAR